MKNPQIAPLPEGRGAFGGWTCRPAERSGGADVLRREGQTAHALAGGGKDRVGNRTLDHGGAGLTQTSRGLLVSRRQEGDVDLLRRFVDANHAVHVEVVLLDRIVLDRDLAEQTCGLTEVDARLH